MRRSAFHALRMAATPVPAPRVQIGLPAISGPTYDLGAPFAQHESWQTGMVPSLGDGTTFRGSEPSLGLPAAPGGRTAMSSGHAGFAGDGSGAPGSGFAGPDVLGAPNVPVPRTQAGVVANAVVSRLMRIRRKPSTRAWLRWESPTGGAPYIWRIHARDVAQANVRKMLRAVLRDKGSHGVFIEEIATPGDNPRTGIPLWHIKVYPPEHAPPPPTEDTAGLGNDDGQQEALEQLAPAVAALVRQALEIDANTDAKVLEARIKNLKQRRRNLPPGVRRLLDGRIRVLEAKLEGKQYRQQLQVESERSTRVWRALGYTGTTVAIVAGLAGIALLFSTQKTVSSYAKKNPSHKRRRRHRRSRRRR